MQVTKETVIGDLLQEDASVVPILLDAGMHCIGCPSSMGESIELACLVHGIDPDALVDALNEHLEGK